MRHINLSFSACGFLGIYHLGAASALRKHGQKLLEDVRAFAGASAGSLVASVLLTAPEKIEECREFTYSFADEIRRQAFGAVTPGYDFMARLRSGMEAVLPPNAHQLAHSRLHVSVTNTKTRQNALLSSFSSREDLIQVLLASSFVPVYAGLRPVEFNGQGAVCPERRPQTPTRQESSSSAQRSSISNSALGQFTSMRSPFGICSESPYECMDCCLTFNIKKWVDGALTNSLPVLPVGRTVTISPFSGRPDISPQDKGMLDLYVSISNQDIRLSMANLVRLNQALFPPTKRKMESLYQRGFEDAVKFLVKENLFR